MFVFAEKKPKSKKDKSSEVCDDMSDLLARMSLKNTTTLNTVKSTTAAQDKPAEILPEVPCTEEKQDGAKTEDPVNQQEVKPDSERLLLSPLPPPASPAVTSLSTSTVVDNLHLSNIDWEAWSFTTSPSQVASSGKMAQESSARVDTEASGSDLVQSGSDSGSPVGPETNRARLLPENEPCSLRERLLMKNALKSIRPCSESTECASVTTDRSEEQSIPPKGTDSTVVIGHSKADSGHLETEENKSVLLRVQAQSRTTGQLPVPVSQKAVGGCNLKIPASTSTSVTTASKAKQLDVGSTNPSTKYKFVKTSKMYAPALLQQTKSSDHSRQKQPKGPDLKPRKASKPSVCVGLVYSSDDSDVENQPRKEQRLNKANKSKSVSVYPVRKPINPVQKPIHPVHLSIPAAKRAPATQQKPDPRSGEIPGVSRPECLSQSQKAEVEVIDLCASAPGSPLCSAPSENDDSVVSIESPLPLAERLKLRFVK